MHELYTKYLPLWTKCRDAIEGEEKIKSKGTEYLPPLPSHIDKPARYRAYLHRATFYNATDRTVSGLVGAVFRRSPIVQNTDSTLSDRLLLSQITANGENINQLAETLVEEILSVGRVGILLDRPAPLDPDSDLNIFQASFDDRPYAAVYKTEDIVDWTEIKVGRNSITTSVLLREKADDPIPSNLPGGPRSQSSVPSADFTYRYLGLDEEGFYYQQIYNAALSAESPRIYIVNQGRKINYIPFFGITKKHLTLTPEAPPIRNIVDLNLSHYRSYASLEHGRMYTAFPQYYVSYTEKTTGFKLDNSEDTDEDSGSVTPYSVDADQVWEIEEGRPGILEFQGSGLNSLENAIEQKAAQIQALGGRLITPMKSMPATSGVALVLQELGDAAILRSIADRVSTALNRIIAMMIDWENIILPDPAKVPTFSFQSSFSDTKITGRELRAILALYKEHSIPTDVLYHALREAGVLPSEMTKDEFTDLLKDPEQLWRLDPRVIPGD